VATAGSSSPLISCRVGTEGQNEAVVRVQKILRLQSFSRIGWIGGLEQDEGAERGARGFDVSISDESKSK
jgi:hypothetical protein